MSEAENRVMQAMADLRTKVKHLQAARHGTPAWDSARHRAGVAITTARRALDALQAETGTAETETSRTTWPSPDGGDDEILRAAS